MSKEETQVCKWCGREFSIFEYGISSYNQKRRTVCKACYSERRREKQLQLKLADGLEKYNNGELVKIRRKYKKPYHFQILYRSESSIDSIAKDEVFVRLLDYKSAWISNYGRLIQQLDDGTYQLVKGVRSRTTKELTYTLNRNVYFKSKDRWGYKKERVNACDLVIQMFVVNYDMKHNTMVWHKNNDTNDNYYKHLFPVTDKQYRESLRVHEQDGAVTSKQIINIVNAVEFKPDDWKPWHNKRTYEGVGYVGAESSDIDSESCSFIKWKNMIQRCYNKKVHKLKPYYMDKNVCVEWQNYQNFKIWFDAHYIPGTKVDLDKDLLCKESNMYSPETCSFLTHYINTVFEERGIKSSITPNGNNIYSVSISILDKKIDLGIYDTEESAKQGLIDGKIKYIKELAESCKGKVQDYVYEAMLRYEI
ncbi:hypothetical protein DW025_04810 [Coprococcus sp. AF38-1]|uniref:hypothetical protein n=1 Tax=Coprococcus sp. AF38-1 TaxID=2302943 RepID=UPI000E75745A|nr:hypothetical protein [Coprococcus sp. AF38-1]RJW75911.1 hypothetical protein DW025_04810 [Coprococcus sp. AF38-1]